MDLSTFIVAVFCLIDDRLKDLGRLRERGPAPTLCDAEALTIEVVGEFLGLDEDTELFAYFRRHYVHFSSRTSCGCIAPPSLGRPPTSGRSRSSSGESSSPAFLTTLPSPSATRCPCQ